jgi:CheY-like chemotaxis protein
MPHPCTVLVADGDRDYADTVAMMLNGSGLDADSVYDGPAAIQFARNFRPRSVVMDVMMPRLSGFVVAAELRKHLGRSIQLVAYTDHASVQDRQKIAEAGFDDLVPKAADPLELFRVLSPDLYETITASVRANTRQIRAQLNLAHSLVEHSTITPDEDLRIRIRDFLAKRIETIGDSLARLPISRMERSDLELELAAVRRRLQTKVARHRP